MGKLENHLSKQVRNTRIQRVILETIALTGILTVAMIAPNAVQVFGKIFGYGKKKPPLNSIARTRRNLVENGLLRFEGRFLKLTSKGERALRVMRYSTLKLPAPKHWDGKWRVIIFDIVESRRPIRDKVRNNLTSIGFVRIQDSVWVYPYSCEDFITLLKADFRIGKEVLYVIVNQIENDHWLRERFGLKSEN